MNQLFVAAQLEFKSKHDPDRGEFTGYGAVYGNTDAHGDLILPGAFAATLAERKSAGVPMPMHLNHGLPQLGGIRGVGIWPELAEDGRGLLCKGRISGMNTDAGRWLYERVRDGAIGGLSIGFKVRAGGASYERAAGGPRRTIRAADVGEISLTDEPCNALARVDAVKTRLARGELPTHEELAEELRGLGFDPDQAGAVATSGLKSLAAGGAGAGLAIPPAAAEAVREMRAALGGFSLPSFT